MNEQTSAFIPRANWSSRKSLADSPLDTPICLQIDPSSGCNFKCAFCPTGDTKIIKESGRVNSILEFGLFKKIIDDCSEFKSKINTLKLYKDGEPFLNKNLTKMVKYAKESNKFERVFITTNGSLLTEEISKQLIEAELDVLHVSLEGMNSKTYKSFAKFDIDFNVLVKNIEFFYKNKKNTDLSVKVVAENLELDEKQLFIDTFKSISDSCFIENISPVWPGFDVSHLGTLDKTVYGEQVEQKEVCPYLFYQFVINSDGSVSACCVDWGRKLLIGDVSDSTVLEVWNGFVLKELRKTHLNFNRKKIDTCENCGQITHAAKDNIDLYAKDILKRL